MTVLGHQGSQGSCGYNNKSVLFDEKGDALGPATNVPRDPKYLSLPHAKQPQRGVS